MELDLGIPRPEHTEFKRDIPLSEQFSQELTTILNTPETRIFWGNEYLLQRDGEAEFSYQPQVLAFRGGSAHHVFGGEISINLPGNPERTKVKTVAKRHEYEYQGTPRGVKEFMHGRKVLEKGYRTIEPLAVVMGRNKEHYIFTLLDPTLQSGDTIEWSGYQDKATEESALYLDQVARLLAKMNKDGIYHFDLQHKNIGRDKSTGEVFFFDWESSTVDENINQNSTAQNVSIYEQVKVLLSSTYDQKNLRESLLGSIKTHKSDINRIKRYMSKDEFKDHKEMIEALRKLPALAEFGGLLDTLDQMDGTYEDIRKAAVREISKTGVFFGSGRYDKKDTIEDYWQAFNSSFLQSYLSEFSLPPDQSQQLTEQLKQFLLIKCSLVPSPNKQTKSPKRAQNML